MEVWEIRDLSARTSTCTRALGLKGLNKKSSKTYFNRKRS